MSRFPFAHTSTSRDIRNRHAPRALAATIILGLALSGCGPKPEEPAAKPELAIAPPKAAASVCQASSNWISNPNPPLAVAAEESFCDFYQFSWQWFLAEVSPSPTMA
jgi:hypothetical protein